MSHVDFKETKKISSKYFFLEILPIPTNFSRYKTHFLQ